MSETIPVQFSDERSDPQAWSAKIYPGDMHSQSVTIHICSPVLSSVGLYRLLVQIDTRQNRRSYAVGTFVLLCNPWLKGGSMYKCSFLLLSSDFDIILLWKSFHSTANAFQMIQCTCHWMSRSKSTSRVIMGCCTWAAIITLVGGPGRLVRYVTLHIQLL